MRKATVIFLFFVGFSASAIVTPKKEASGIAPYSANHDYPIANLIKNLTCSTEADTVILYYQNRTWEDYKVDTLITTFQNHGKCSLVLKR
jgi:hypothetical protein